MQILGKNWSKTLDNLSVSSAYCSLSENDAKDDATEEEMVVIIFSVLRVIGGYFARHLSSLLHMFPTVRVGFCVSRSF